MNWLQLLLLVLMSTVVKAADRTAVVPFKIDVSESTLNDLKHRLDNVRWGRVHATTQNYETYVGKHGHTVYPDTCWARGACQPFLKDLVEYWQTSYDWSEQQRRLNDIPQYTTEIDGLQIHFVHVRSSNKSAIPLIMSHGWPGSFLEYTRVIPLWSNDFHFVGPSLPGYAFSTAPQEDGFDPQRIAEVYDKLMVRLGYSKYVAQGGDWGSRVVHYLGLNHGDHCKAIHMNMLVAHTLRSGIGGFIHGLAGLLMPSLVYEKGERHALSDPKKLAKGLGYMIEQATFPHTIGFALSDTPAGILSWFVEKFYHWGDVRNGDVESQFSRDDLITNVMIYWISNSITSSMQIYYENFHTQEFGNTGIDRGYVEVPSAVAVFPREPVSIPKSDAAYFLNLQRHTVFDRGGHFPALEEPELLADDVRTFIGSLGFAWEPQGHDSPREASSAPASPANPPLPDSAAKPDKPSGQKKTEL